MTRPSTDHQTPDESRVLGATFQPQRETRIAESRFAFEFHLMGVSTK
jgi:hypothetical protein